MDRSAIEERVLALLAQMKGVSPEAVRPESSLEKDLGLDSLAMLDFFFALEEEFGVSLPDEVAERIVTVGEAVEVVTERTG